MVRDKQQFLTLFARPLRIEFTLNRSIKWDLGFAAVCHG